MVGSVNYVTVENFFGPDSLVVAAERADGAMISDCVVQYPDGIVGHVESNGEELIVGYVAIGVDQLATEVVQVGTSKATH